MSPKVSWKMRMICRRGIEAGLGPTAACGNRNSYLLGCKIMTEFKAIRALTVVLLAGLFWFPGISRAQTDSDQSHGTVSGNYQVEQTAEVGYRKDWINGNLDTYDTFVNLGTGARLLDYTLDMRSINHMGLLFDNLSFSNFGYGGDPNDVSRLRVEKNKWYEFSLVFRRDKNYWDYNLLANPLNPVPFSTTSPVPATFATTNPSFASTQSPHSLDRVRRMQDYDLMLLPQSRVRFRLGYSRNVDEGPSLTTLHGPTDFLLLENFRMTTNSYHVGVDFRILPKTTISFDEFLEYNKQDTTDSLANTPFVVQTVSGLAPGTLPVNLGLDWYYPPSATTVPCAAPFLATGYATPTCKMFQSYTRSAPTRNSMPTERLSLQSTIIPKLEMSASASYSRSNNVVSNLFDSANEYGDRAGTNVRDALVSGPANTKQVFTHADWSGIYSLNQKVRIVDSFRFEQWQNPGYTNQDSSYLFGTLPQVAGQTGINLPIASFAPIVAGGPSFASICAPTVATPNPITCPQHNATASADISGTAYANYLGQRLISNTIQFQVDLTKRITGRIGYSYENRRIAEIDSNSIPIFSTYYPGGPGGTAGAMQGGALAGNYFLAARGSCALPVAGSALLPAGCNLNSDGSITFTNPASPAVPRTVSTINEQVGLAGLTMRPMDSLRINADFEFGYNDYSYTRIWPRQVQSYKVHVNYRPTKWANIDGAIDINENRDNISQIFNLEHARTYSFAVMLMPNSKFTYTLGFNYTNLYLQTYICFVDSFGALTGPAVPTYAPCTIPNSTAGQGATQFYANGQDYAYSDVMWKPINRLTLSLGYSGSFVYGSEEGSTLYLDPLQPAGTLAYNYHKPFASIQLNIYKGLSYKTTWNYYGYDSKTPVNTSIPITNANAPNGLYALQPIPGPNFNGSTLMFALRYAFGGL